MRNEKFCALPGKLVRGVFAVLELIDDDEGSAMQAEKLFGVNGDGKVKAVAEVVAAGVDAADEILRSCLR